VPALSLSGALACLLSITLIVAVCSGEGFLKAAGRGGGRSLLSSAV